MTVVIVALPTIAHDFKIDSSLGIWITFLPELISASLCAPIGRLADMYGCQRMFFCGCVCHIIAQVLCATAGSFEVLLAARAFTGLGDALSKVTGSTIILCAFSTEVSHSTCL